MDWDYYSWYEDDGYECIYEEDEPIICQVNGVDMTLMDLEDKYYGEV